MAPLLAVAGTVKVLNVAEGIGSTLKVIALMPTVLNPALYATSVAVTVDAEVPELLKALDTSPLIAPALGVTMIVSHAP